MERRPKYGIGQQSFEVLRNQECVYVDKTRFIEKIVESGGLYYFLGRPRRFGKSLFLSTLKCFFQGKRELFRGLYAERMNWDWEPHPVLHLDLNIEKYQDPNDLHEVLDNIFRQWEKEYDIENQTSNLSLRFSNIIKGAYLKTGKRVIILIDEYDKPLVNNLHNKKQFESYRNELAAIYSNLKSSADYLRLVFMTGVSRFGDLSVFSGLNNIRDISFSDAFSDLCGITERELTTYFQYGISELASKFQKGKDEIIMEMKRRYDGYRFSAYGEEIYNPFSVLNVMEDSDFRNYWISSGIATLLMLQLKRFHIRLETIINSKCNLSSLQGLDLDNPEPLALLYQTGYLTIKGYNQQRAIYHLGIPNLEVEEGFYSFLLPYYTNLHGSNSMVFVYNLVDEFNKGEVDAIIIQLKSLFSSISYEMKMDREENLHNALLILMKLVGLEVETEYRTSNGRIDLFVKTDRYYYIIELKLDKSAREALDQINAKDYALPFATDGREIIKIGINFSTETRTISEWIAE